MLRRWIALIVCTATLAAVAPACAAVYVTQPPPEIEKTADGEQFIQQVTLANEYAHFNFVYDVNRTDEAANEITSHWWQWEQGYIPIGLTEPSHANWYWQAFMRWTIDGMSLHTYAATMRVVRESGPDGMVEYTWDTPKARVWARFALVTGSDKLMMFAGYEPKEPVETVRLTLACYPASFAQPRNRAVTTVEGTRLPGETIEMDLENERWVLFEDTTEGRPGAGSGGMIIGTPDAFSSITIPVGDYGINPVLELAPGQQSFAIGLYDYPSLPDYQKTREYFLTSADAEADALEQMAAGDLDQPLPAQTMNPERVALLKAEGERRFERPTEVWRPDPTPLDFNWAASLPGEPINAAIYCRRYAAWETMELARRLEMTAEHVYFDGRDTLSNNTAWPYRHSTGDFAIPQGVAALKAATMATDPKLDVAIVSGVFGDAVPGVARTAILEQVAAGKGLLIVGPAGQLRGWPDETFATPDPGLSEEILAAFDWEAIPGYRPGERGRVGEDLPVRAYSYGDGHVVHLNINLCTYSALVPRNDATEGLDGATDRCLAIAARCVLGAAERLPEVDFDAPFATEHDPANVSVRVQDDLDRVLMEATRDLVKGEDMDFGSAPGGRPCFLDLVLRDDNGDCIGFTSRALPAMETTALAEIEIEPSTITYDPAPPLVDMPEGGQATFSATVADAPAGAVVNFEVRDAFERVVARASAPAVNGAVQVQVDLPRPVTVCHLVDVSLMQGDTERAFERKRFTMTVPYPYDDFTALVWTYAGGDPLLQRTDRMCYEMGAEMSDLCHMGSYDDVGAAREYSVSARSGMRMIPYVTRLAGSANANNERDRCFHDPALLTRMQESLIPTCRQAAAYSCAAYTLGDENYLFRGENECCHTPASIAAFREWLGSKYGTIAALNAEWGTDYADFNGFERPMLLAEVAQQISSFAPWIDHKLFMDETFASAHDEYADIIRSVDPGAKVGWDGLLTNSWRAGYDYEALTRNLEMNQTYTVRWLDGELYRSFKRDDALTGKWGNHVGDVRGGWAALPWDCLFAGDQSVWWWTSWGCDYIPFYPDLTPNVYADQFFEAVREVTAGPGKLLLHGQRQHSGIGVLYSQRDLFAAAIVGENIEKGTLDGDGNFLREHEALIKAVRDLGYQYEHVSTGQLASGVLTVEDYPVFVMPLAMCVSDETAQILREYVEAGGTLIVDGRAGMLTGEGAMRETRALDELLGVAGPTGPEALATESASLEVTVDGVMHGTQAPQQVTIEPTWLEVLEPGLTVTTGTALAQAGDTPVLVVNTVGEGRAITLNIAAKPFLDRRAEGTEGPLMNALDAAIRGAGIAPPCELASPDGGRVHANQQVVFTDGQATYLGLQPDILMYDIADQQAHVTLPEPTIVYDMRTGKQVGKGPVSEWDVTLSRGHPLAYAMLPYRVRRLQVEAPRSAGLGETVQVGATVETSGEPGYHVVRVDLYAPGSDTPHRQYSQNIACDAGSGTVSIPFALSDPAGEWRLRLRDAATGVTQTRTIELN